MSKSIEFLLGQKSVLDTIVRQLNAQQDGQGEGKEESYER